MKRRNKMTNRLWTAFGLGGALALTIFAATPAMADEWDKKTTFEFSAPVQIPGKVLPAGKYVFELADNESDRNIVEIFSEDSNGNDTLIATLLAVPKYTQETPDKATVRFDERHTGTPEAIKSWFYPGENTGWEFVYPEGETLQSSMNATPAPAPETATAAPALPAPPAIQENGVTPEDVAVEEEITVAENNEPVAPAPPEAAPAPTSQPDQNTADRTLPETGGYSALAFPAGIGMLTGGTLILFASRRRSVA
jgi:LPXTG-motif cell wall-anchored protein